MSTDSADPLPDSFEALAATCRGCGERGGRPELLRRGLCRVCRAGGGSE